MNLCWICRAKAGLDDLRPSNVTESSRLDRFETPAAIYSDRTPSRLVCTDQYNRCYESLGRDGKRNCGPRRQLETIFNYLRKSVVPRPGIEPGLAAAANADHPEQRNSNEIRLFCDRALWVVVPFCPDL
jgi:hypothetical protein